MQLLKKTTLAITLLSGFIFGNAQMNDTPRSKSTILKINLSALFVKNIALQLEHRVTRKSTVAVAAHLLPFGTVPFKSTIKRIIDDSSTDIDNLKVGNFGITPEFRFYLGKKGAFHGIYIGPFLNYNSYKTDLPINYANNTKTGIFSGKVQTYTAGIQIGAQWQLSKSIFMDWWILGPNYGGGSGKVDLAGSLDYFEQGALTVELQQLKDDVPFNLIKSYSVRNDGATINIKGPWVGIRGGGFNLGFNF